MLTRAASVRIRSSVSQRGPEIARRSTVAKRQGLKTFREHSDNLKRYLVEQQRLADGAGVAGKMAQQQHVPAVRTIVLLRESAAKERLDSERGEKVVRDSHTVDDFRNVATREGRRPPAPIQGHGFEGAVARSPVFPCSERYVGRLARVRIAFGEGNEPSRFAIRERVQQHGFDDAEDGGIGTDAEGEGEDGDEREGGGFRQRAKSVFQVLGKYIHQDSLRK